MKSNDTFVILPTGYGKSLCYSLLPYIFDSLRRKEDSSIVLCVSPLVSLMIDQKQKFSPRGLSTEFVGQDDPSALQKVQGGLVQLLFMSPESFIRSR